jgi:outer membrane receptor protein involved in Fe transport
MDLCNLRSALRLASLPVGIATALAAPHAFAQDTTPAATAPVTTAPAEQEPTTLDRIEVTGSRIRRVDAEDASPVITLDREAIEKTGKLTIGDLVQELPNIAGAATNPQVNNGGGTGASTIDLRGFGSERTLVLVNGRRVVHQGGTDGGADVNAIPASAVERIEVLTVGASSVYGSDAVAGVVNFIMRKDFEGMQASIDYGISDRDDGQRTGGSFTFGQVGEKGNIIAGVNYNKFNAISSGDRDFSAHATYLYSGSVSVRGSSRNPRGRITLTDAQAATFGCATVTRIPGASGATLADYRCYSGAADSYNYQAVNLVVTPQERTNAFFLGNYQMTDDTNAFVEYYHNKTSANFAIAALPFDALGDAVLISADNYYNPFGVDFGRDAAGTVEGNQFLTRWTSVGQRRSLYATSTDQLVAGVEGFLGDTWKWDFALNYGHISQQNQSYGYMDYAGLAQALGPSFLDTDGVVKCGAPGAIVGNCTPLNVFNIEDPATLATLSAYEARPIYTTTYVQRGFEANASGELFNMPAGAAQLAFGAAWRREYQRSEVDYIAIARADGTCLISQEACGSPITGSFNVGELYAELFLPLLKDVPFAHTLNLTLGSRYSNYSNFGNTTNSKAQLEWRPLDDLLFRATVAEVFRAPSIGDLFAGPQGNAPQATDPCVGYTNDPAHANACGAPTGATNIPAGGITSTGLGQTTGVVSGSVAAGYDLQPESGKSFDWGVVYDPNWLPGFSVSLDYWRLYLNDTITTIGAQTVLTACYNNNSSPFCDFINRFQSGQINFIAQPTVNLGRLDSKGWDLALRYKLPDTAWGSWTMGFDGTYIAQADRDIDTTEPNDAVLHLGGTFNKDFGNYSRVRARAFVNWGMGDWSASWRTRYVGGFDVGSDDFRQGTTADGHGCDPDAPQFCYALPFSSYVIHSFNVGYALPSVNSRFEFGVDNVFDKQPPLLYQNNVLNANTDVNTFDTVGRYYWGRYTVKF